MTKYSVKELDLSYLSPAVLSAAKNFADLKYQIDVTGRRNPAEIPNDLHGRQRHGEYDGPYGGDTFLESIIPFIPFSPDCEVLGVKNIPIAHTLGRSWRWWPDHCCGDEDKIIEHISSPENAQYAYYYLVKELGVIFASEGKNRVNFCRHHGIEKIPVKLIQFNYPPAHSIKIYTIKSHVGTETVAVLDGRYLQKISHISYALPLLNSYGINVDTEWPISFPSIESIYEHAYCAKVDSVFNVRTIDLDIIKAKEAYNSNHKKKGYGTIYKLINFFLK
ncbi:MULTISPECIES: hypothetical protein [Aeromonas]|uniref:Uncharacterized protein n=1 Tax=Aeromonas salmonicida TaxID=645 RepID=A0AAX1PBL5_AERSA|nr:MULTISPECIES: hypothetical protein [Aeromonas]MDM5065571.1 hypothetical protein [Aeromonas salmonicida]MDU4190644.1 hypothetical protein [Aeromonas sp.]RAI97033.1 hypothetical protein DEU50_1411 [Aeromonas salmonicida]